MPITPACQFLRPSTIAPRPPSPPSALRIAWASSRMISFDVLALGVATIELGGDLGSPFADHRS